MKLVKPSHEILSITPDAIQLIEKAGRTCYKSEIKISEDSAEKFIQMLIDKGHESVLEHAQMSVRFICDRGVSHEIVRHRLASYCLSGNTIVRSMGQKSWTIKQLYEWQQDVKRKGRLKLITLRSMSTAGLIVPNKILDILYSGVQDVYEVITESGRTITATLNHRFATPTGYTMLRSLKVGDILFANGLLALENEEYLRRRYLKDNLTRKELAKEIGCCETFVYKAFKRFNIFKPWSDRPNRHPGYGRKGMFSEEQKRDTSKRMSGSGNHRWKGENVGITGGYNRTNKMYAKEVCESCGNKFDLENHHVDKNPRNTNNDNIRCLCTTCHKQAHGKQALAVYSDRIISITYVGKEDTYDVSMRENPHNFVANGLVVHNSQESSRYCNYGGKDMEFITPPWLEPEIVGTVIPTTIWYWAMESAERCYNDLITKGWSPQQARSVLPNSVKTEIVMTANLREWRHFFRLRCAKAAHPQMRELVLPLLKEANEKIPGVFKDLDYEFTPL